MNDCHDFAPFFTALKGMTSRYHQPPGVLEHVPVDLVRQDNNNHTGKQGTTG
ncbi:MAG: hypothetical protein HQL60_01595 [Magnetococcales bacterium]|nr:hypothetical protein [Magnetococcales bacterium]